MKRAHRKEKSNGQGQGQKWVRNEKRLALYLRDGMACCYCGDTVENGARLTLDHLKPYSKGGSNKETNLITCCSRCNSSRGNRAWKEFAASVAEYLNHGVKPEHIMDHIATTVKRPIDVKAAKEIIAHRGGFSAAVRDANCD